MPGTGMNIGRAARFAILLVVAVLAQPGPALPVAATKADSRFLTGQLLVAQPDMGDPRFRGAVIFIAQHNAKGALGLIVNRPLGEIDYATILENMGDDPTGLDGTVPVFYGGPVEPRRGFVLYTNDYSQPPLIPVDDRYSVTMSKEIMRDMAKGAGPKHSLLVVGYAGWGAGQLERELERRDWVVAPSDDRILFDQEFDTKWKRAYDARFIEL